MGTWKENALKPNPVQYPNPVRVGTKIWVMGGRDAPASERYDYNEAYDLLSDSWSTHTPCPVVGDAGIAAYLESNSYHVIPGYPITSADKLYKYDIGTDTWTLKSTMPTYRWDYGGGVVNGKLYVIGGSRNYTAPRYENECYDPGANSWSTKASVPLESHKCGSCVSGNKIYILGGQDSDGNPLNTIQIYNVLTDSWSYGSGAEYGALGGGQAVSWEPINGQIVCPSRGTFSNTMAFYDIGNDTWSYNQDCQFLNDKNFSALPRFLPVYNKSLYMIGGATYPTNEVATNFSYPQWDTITVKLNMLFGNKKPPSTVGTGGNESVSLNFHRAAFYHNGRFWVFYTDGTNLKYSSSTDGLDWGTATTIRPCTWAMDFSIWFDGTFVHYVYAPHDASGEPIVYRRGTPLSTGSVTWDTPTEQTVQPGESNVKYFGPCVQVDSSGYPWVGYRKRDASSLPVQSYAYVTKSSLNNGSWATDTGFPYQLSTLSAAWYINPVALTNNKMYVIYMQTDNGYMRGKLYDSTWSPEETISPSTIRACDTHSEVAIGDNVYLVFLEDNNAHIHFVYRDYSTGQWSNEEDVELSDSNLGSYPILSCVPANKSFYVFWVPDSFPDRIFYKRRIDGKWDDIPIDWVTDNGVYSICLSGYAREYNNKIGLCWENSISPIYVKHQYIEIKSLLITKIIEFISKVFSSVVKVLSIKGKIFSLVSKLFSMEYWMGLYFHIKNVIANPTSVLREGDEVVNVEAYFRDKADLPASSYTGEFTFRDSDNNEYGPYSSTIYKIDTYEYKSSISWNPPDTVPIDHYDVKAKVTK